jgi:hypothetical protein
MANVFFYYGTILNLVYDDFGHLAISGVVIDRTMVAIEHIDIPEAFRRSFFDTHPPLRNLILARWFHLSNGLLDIRKPFIVSSFLFVALMAALLREMGIGRVSTFLVVLMYGFGKQIMVLGLATRGYILMLAFTAAAAVFMQKFIRTSRHVHFFISLTLALMAVLFEYGSFFCVSSFSDSRIDSRVSSS